MENLFHVIVEYGVTSGMPISKDGFVKAHSLKEAEQLAVEKVRNYPTTAKIWGWSSYNTDSTDWIDFEKNQPADFWDDEQQ